MNYRDLIYKNILDECVIIADYCSQMGIALPQDSKKLLQEIEDGSIKDLNSAIAEIIKKIWDTPAVQDAIEKRQNSN